MDDNECLLMDVEKTNEGKGPKLIDLSKSDKKAVCLWCELKYDFRKY